MTPDRELEIRLLHLLRHREYADRWLEAVQPVAGYLSREAQIIVRALDYAFRNGTAPLVGLRDLWAILQEQFPLKKDELTPLKDVFSTLRAYKEADVTLSSSIVEQYLTKAALMHLSIRAAQAVEAGTLDTDFIEELVRIAEPRSKAEEQAIWSYDPTSLTDEIMSPVRYPTPWKRVNHEIDGGYSPGELIEVCALSKVGKTHFLINEVAHTLRRGRCAGYITVCDLDRGAVGLLLARVLLNKSRNYIREHPNVLKKLKATMNKKEISLEIADYTHRPVGVREIEAAIKRWHTKHGKRLHKVVIDRLEEAVPPTKSDATRIDIASIWKHSRQIAHKYSVPVLVDSQAGAHVEGRKRIKITDGAESKVGKAKILDLFYGLSAPTAHDPTQLFLSIQGRRELSGDLIRMRLKTKTGRIVEENW